jgi:hypothetical protein
MRADGKSLTRPSLSEAQLKSFLADFQLSKGLAPRPGTKTMLKGEEEKKKGQLVSRIQVRSSSSHDGTGTKWQRERALLDVWTDAGRAARVEFFDPLLNDIVAFLGARFAGRRRPTRCRALQRHDCRQVQLIKPPQRCQ